MEERKTRYVITSHVAYQIKRRGLDEKAVHSVLAKPEQKFEIRPGRMVFQSRTTPSQKAYLIRVFVDTDRDPPEVVTAYRTRKISKYWGKEYENHL